MLWNKYANETGSDSEERHNCNIDEEDLEEEKSKTNPAISFKLTKIEIKRVGIEKIQERTQMKHNKLCQELEKKKEGYRVMLSGIVMAQMLLFLINNFYISQFG